MPRGVIQNKKDSLLCRVALKEIPKGLDDSFIVINRLSEKGTDGVMKQAVHSLENMLYWTREDRHTTTTRGGKWRGCIAATPHSYMVRVSVKASTTGAKK